MCVCVYIYILSKKNIYINKKRLLHARRMKQPKKYVYTTKKNYVQKERESINNKIESLEVNSQARD